jgi:hypothetical protein
MKKLIFVSILVFIFYASAFSQATAPCPAISISNPGRILMPGDEMFFTVTVGQEAEKYSLKYEWTVTGGKIVGGQSTLIVKIVSDDTNYMVDVTATLKIKGLPPNCLNTVSERGYQPAESTVGLISEIPNCPKILITAPPSLVEFGSLMSFSALVNPRSDAYGYKWTATAGNIEGQGTPAIKIRADKPAMSGVDVEVAVEITGLPENCPNTVSEIVSISPDERFAFPVDKYQKISFRAEKAKLDALIHDDLKNETRIVLIFEITFAENDNLNLLKKRVLNIARYLTEKRKIPQNRFNFLFGESGFYQTSIHLFSTENAEFFPSWEESLKQLRHRKQTPKSPRRRI